MRAVPTLAVVASSVVLLASCSGSSRSTSGHPGSTLRSALGEITATAATRGSVSFSAQAAVLKADGGSSQGVYQRAFGLGLGTLGAYSDVVPRVLGLTPDKAEYAIQAGNPPDAVALVNGVSTGAIGAKLTALGATKSGDTYRLGPDHAPQPNSTVSAALPTLLGFDVVRLNGSQLSYSSAASDLDLATGGGSTLADDADFSAAADCLGDPLGAVLTDKLPGAGGQVVGVGLSGGHGVQPTETMCLVASTDSAARAAESRIRKAVSSGSSREERRPWSQLLSGATVSRSGTTVRLTARSAGTAGILLAGVDYDDLPGLTG